MVETAHCTRWSHLHLPRQRRPRLRQGESSRVESSRVESSRHESSERLVSQVNRQHVTSALALEWLTLPQAVRTYTFTPTLTLTLTRKRIALHCIALHCIVLLFHDGCRVPTWCRWRSSRDGPVPTPCAISFSTPRPQDSRYYATGAGRVLQ